MNTYARMRYGVHGVCWYLFHHLEQIHVCVCKCVYTYIWTLQKLVVSEYIRTHTHGVCWYWLHHLEQIHVCV